MKRIFVLCAALIATAVAAMAQDEPAAPAGKWETNSTPALKISEFMFNNWSKSGNSQIDATATFFGNYKYTHPRFIWDNIADLAYGYAWQDLEDDPNGELFETRRKSNDKIDLTSAISWKPFSKLPDWGASFTANLKTQFGHGYEYDGVGATQTQKLVSDFFAPAYLTTALSFEYKKPNWSVALSFLTGKTTFVCNDDLIDSGYTYGVIQEDPTSHTHAYFALGSYVKAQYLKKDLLPQLDLYARLELFYDYKKPNNMGWDAIEAFVADPADPTAAPDSKYLLADGENWADLQGKNWLARRAFETDIDFEIKLDYRFSDHIAANFALNLKYDTDFSGMGQWGHWQIYQMAGVQVFFSWKTPKA